MSSQRDTALSEGAALPFESRRIMFGGGVVIAALGLLAILAPYATGISLSLILGAILVVGGITYVAQAFSATGWAGFLFEFLLGVVYAVAGIALLSNPVLALATLTVLLVAFLVVDGVIEVVMAYRLRTVKHWYWLLVSGLLSLLFAGLVWIEFPSSAAWAIGLLFGVALFTTGLGMISVSRGLRKTEGVRRRPDESLLSEEPSDDA